MTGVDILATQEVAVEFIFNWPAFWITFVVLVFIGAVYGIITVLFGDYEWFYIPISILVFTVVGLLFGGLMGTGIAKPVTYETQYKVIISDEVSMTDFLEKYEIVSTEGKIYTVREVKGE